MTSKEINDMIIDLENQIERFGGMSQFNYQLDILKSYKQDLERLEVLEKENHEYKWQEHLLNEILTGTNYDAKEIINLLLKYKNAIEIIKNYYKFKLFPPAMDNIPEISISTDWEHYISQQEYELLKEVLGNGLD